jgi:biopolymer transport protein ExbD
MRKPSPRRLGLYLVIAGLVIDAERCCFGQFEYILSFTGVLSAFLVPIGVFLILAELFAVKPKPEPQKVSLTSIGPIQNSELESGADKGAQPISRRLLFSMPLWVGLVLVLAGHLFFTGAQYWRATRTVFPFDMPVSLSHGHIRTGDFYINLPASYYVELFNDRDWHTGYTPPCHFQYAGGIVSTRLTVFKDGRMVSQEESRDSPFLGDFDAEEKGLYSVDVELLSYPDCLNQSHPRLAVEAGTFACNNRYSMVSWSSIVLMVLGFYIVTRSTAQEKVQSFEIPHPVYPASASRLGRFPLRPRISNLPTFGYLYVSAIIPLAILMPLTLPAAPQGIWVSLRVPPRESRPQAWQSGLILRIGLDGKWYLNSEKVSPQDLSTVLVKNLSRRAERVVYLEADPDVEYQQVITATEAIKAVHVKVVLLTPQQKKLRQKTD